MYFLSITIQEKYGEKLLIDCNSLNNKLSDILNIYNLDACECYDNVISIRLIIHNKIDKNILDQIHKEIWEENNNKYCQIDAIWLDFNTNKSESSIFRENSYERIQEY